MKKKPKNYYNYKRPPFSEFALSAPIVMITNAFRSKGFGIVQYKIKSEKLSGPVRLVLISDLHDSTYGENQCGLIQAVSKQKPDLVMLTGDIFVEYAPYDSSIRLLEGIASQYPCYYVSGNHEFLGNDTVNIKDIIRSFGITVLEGNVSEITVNGQKIRICGLDDPLIGEEKFKNQMEKLSCIEKKEYTVLLSHHPELVDDYKKMNPDLVLSGHAHGGQWRIPFLVNGLFAPHQGWFPKYAGGLYLHGKTTQIVSRGLTKIYIIPRVFNPPELVVIDIEPE
jgi:uncharacterized protein